MWWLWVIAVLVVGFAFYLNYAFGYEQGLRDAAKASKVNEQETPSK